MKRKKFDLGSFAFDGLNNMLLLLLCIVTIYPFLHVAAVSFSDNMAISQGKVSFFPVGFQTIAYEAVFMHPDIWTSYRNTIFYTVVGTAINLLMTTITAYPLAKSWFYGRKLFMMAIFFTMLFGGGLIPNYLLVQGLGLVNTVWAILIPGAIGTWNLIVMMSFFRGIPQELEDSATIDGCSDIGVLFRIVLPLSMPIMAAITLFYAVSHWNSWFSALIYLNDKKLYPLQMILNNIVISGQTAIANAVDEDIPPIAEAVKYAVIIVATLPILLVYPFIQKHFVKGVLIGSLKG